MTPNEITRAASDAIVAFNAGQLEAFRSALASNVVYKEGGTRRRAEGPDAYIQALTA